MKKKHIDAYMKEYDLLEFFEYSENSPSKLVWAENRGNFILKGKSAGWIDKNYGYFRVKINNKCYQAHRIVFAMFHKYEKHSIKIDHIDRNRQNNSKNNLRKSNSHENARNKTKYKNNKSGINGVSIRDNKRFVVQWYENGILKSKSFSIRKFGFDAAMKNAGEFRLQLEKRLNYFGGHGSERKT